MAYGLGKLEKNEGNFYVEFNENNIIVQIGKKVPETTDTSKADSF